MGNFLNNIALFFGSLFAIVNDETRRIRNAFVTTIISVALVYIVQLIFNNLNSTMIIAIICDIVVVYVWFNVRRLISVAGLGEALELSRITTHPRSPETIGRVEAPKLNLLFDLYTATALYALFWMHVVCFFAPLLSLREYPWFGVFLLFGGTAYLIMYPEGALLRKTLVWGIVIALILMFLRLISPAGWIKFVGADPFWAMRVNSADRALATTLSVQEEAEQAIIVTRHKEIQQKIKDHKLLSSEDKKFLKEQSRGLLQRVVGNLSSSSEKKDGKTGRVADSITLPPGDGRVDIKLTLSSSELNRDVLSMYQDPGQGWQQIQLFVNGHQDPSWQWHALTGKGVARYRGISKFLKAGENVVTIQHRLEKQPVALKNIYLDT